MKMEACYLPAVDAVALSNARLCLKTHYKQRFNSMNRANKSTTIVLACIIVSCILVSCSKDDTAILKQNPMLSLTISTGSLVPEFDKEIMDYYVTSMNTLNAIELSFSKNENTAPIYINGVILENPVISLKIENHEDIIISTINDFGAPIEYTIHYLPEDLPKANVIISNTPSNGYIFVNYFEFSLASGFKDYTYIAILDNTGFPVYYKKVPYPGVGNFNYYNTETNQKRFSYGINNRETVIMNENFEEIERLTLLPFNGHDSYPSDNHDLIYFADDHYIIPAYVNRENVDMTAYGGISSVTLIDFVFQEIKNGHVLFEWNSADYPEIFNSVDPVFANQFNTEGPPVDYFHFNSFSIDPSDNNFIVSARHTDQLYKIHRNTGEIIWKMGGTTSDFSLTENETFSHQHHATISKDGTLLLFDNNVTQNQETRALELDINEGDYSIDIVQEYHKDGLFMNIMGSLQKLDNNNYFIGWGGHTSSQINASRSDITEVDGQGNILLDISFTNNLDKFTYSYRALKYNINF